MVAAGTIGCSQPPGSEGASSVATTVLPLAVQDGIVRLQSYNYRTYFSRHQNYYGELTPDRTSLRAAKNRIRSIT